MDHSLPDSSAHGILRAQLQERVAISSSRGSSQLRDGTWVSYVSCTGRQIFTTSDIWEALILLLTLIEKKHLKNLKIYILNGDGLFVKISHDLHYDFIMR